MQMQDKLIDVLLQFEMSRLEQIDLCSELVKNRWE